MRRPWQSGCMRAPVFAVVLVASAVTVVPPSTGRAQEVQQGDAARARQHFKMGVSFFRENNFGAALIEFKRAYEIVPHYKVLFNLGQTYIELQEYGKAVEALQGYLDKGGSALSDSRRQKVEALIAEQQARLVNLTIEADEDGARVYVDENIVGTTPLDGPVQVGAGRRRIRVSKEGFVTAERRVDLGAGDDTSLSFELEPTVAPEAAQPAEAPPPPEPVIVRVESGGDTGIWVAGIATVVLAGATATMAILAASSESDLNAERGRMTTETRLQALSDDVKLRALLTDVGLGLTVTAAVVTTVLWVTDADAADGDDVPSLSVDVSPESAALRWHGRF